MQRCVTSVPMSEEQGCKTLVVSMERQRMSFPEMCSDRTGQDVSRADLRQMGVQAGQALTGSQEAGGQIYRIK